MIDPLRKIKSLIQGGMPLADSSDVFSEIVDICEEFKDFPLISPDGIS